MPQRGLERRKRTAASQCKPAALLALAAGDRLAVLHYRPHLGFVGVVQAFAGPTKAGAALDVLSQRTDLLTNVELDLQAPAPCIDELA